MTEMGWFERNDPAAMLRFLGKRLRDHPHSQANLERFRLFACACCRRISYLLGPDDLAVLDILEAYTQSRQNKELHQARRLHRPAGIQASQNMYRISEDNPHNEVALMMAWAKNLATSAVWEATAKKPTSAAKSHFSGARAVGSFEHAISTEPRSPRMPFIDWELISLKELTVQAALLRDVFGNPFQPAVVNSAWLTENVLNLTRLIHSTHDFASLPVLGDALEDAGCTDSEMLAHCRQASTHVRGCWLIDLLSSANWRAQGSS